MEKCTCGHPKHNHAGSMFLKDGKIVEINNECARPNCGCKKYAQEVR